MNNKSENNSRIAKNTLFLYFRMLITMAVSFYTSRIVLEALGIEDYGIYNVVGGVVTMFSFLNTAMATATQRFLNFDLAINDEIKLNKTFNTSVIIHAIISLIVIILAETIGLWFLNNKLVIPIERMHSAIYVYQCSVLATVVTIMSVPYNALIIAHEKMSAFAQISIIEVLLKLLIVLLLLFVSCDKLTLYSILVLTVSIIIRMIYSIYCKKHFEEARFNFIFDLSLVKEIGSFAAWNLIGNLALVGVTQGLNIILNMFFGPVVNAARGIAVQVQSTLQQFAQNFQMAINPQITKSYATGDYKYMHLLICRSSKFSFMLLYIISLPIYITAPQILDIWLVEPPTNTYLYLRIILLTALIDTISNPLSIGVQATGKIRKYQLTNGLIMLTVVPIAFLALNLYNKAEVAFLVHFIITLFSHIVKLIYISFTIKMSIKDYIKRVYIRSFFIVLFSFLPTYYLYGNVSHSFLHLLITCILCPFYTIIMVFLFGLDSSEKKFIKDKILKYISKS